MARAPRAAEAQMMKIINEWMVDEKFIRLMRWNQSRHWLDTQSLKERNFRDILAWLLSPREGHGLGDHFLIRLLQAACRSDAVRGTSHPLWKAYGNFGWLASGSLMSAMVATEVVCGGRPSSKRRSDIVVIDHDRRVLVVIERKDGSLASEEQLREYREWAEQAYDGFTRVLILSDSRDNEHEALLLEQEWIQLGDEWLAAALSEMVDRDAVPPYINQQLKDFLRQVGEPPEDDQYFLGLEQELASFVEGRQRQVKELRSLLVPGLKRRFIDLTPREVLAHHLPQSSSATLSAALIFSAKNRILLQQICDVSELAALELEIMKRFSHASNLIVYKHRAPRRGDDRLDISIRRFASFSTWPIFLRIIKPYEEASDSVVRVRDMQRLFVRLDFTDELKERVSPNAVDAVLKGFGCRKGTSRYSTLGRDRNIELTYENVEPFLDVLMRVDQILSQFDE